jgi:type I restriction-modification system DNA methylase subunit
MSTATEASQVALSDQHKEAVKSWVPKARKLLETDLTAQLERLGIREGGKVIPLESMSLTPEAVAIRQRVEALLVRDSAAEGTPKRGYDNVLRELTYTTLNRLVGLKAMEARQVLFLVPPAGGAPEPTEVLTPIAGQDRSRYLRDVRAAGGSRYKYDDDAEEALLRDGLQAAYRQINEEIRLLFDPDHEYSCVWPTHAALVKLINSINGDLPIEAYQAPDFLGWVYQFFIGKAAPGESKSEKQRVRDETNGTPRSSYELSVINQFYTPSWVVKVLVDNTLGRLWLQMHPDSWLQPEGPTPLPADRSGGPITADYLVPRTGERIRYARVSDTGEVQRFKRACDITLLDPACGTMHFGQYAFGLFLRMYLEEIEHAGEEGWPAEPSVATAAEIPEAIVANNLFGIDIDPRAIQIASLSLMLTAKQAAIGLGISPTEVQVKRTNLVVANAVAVGKEALDALTSKLSAKLGAPELQQRLFTVLWDNLQNVGELGSLVQVKEGVETVLGAWVEAQAKRKGLGKIVNPKALPLFEAGGIADDFNFQQAQQLVLQRQALEEEAQAIQQELLMAIEEVAGTAASDPAERLFAEDTARGLKLLQVLARRFDVVVMNPPYGSFVDRERVRKFVDTTYPLTKNNIYAAFIDRATQLVENEGYVGALVSSSFTTNTTFKKLRTEILLKRNPLLLMLDLGSGILDDAMVETAALVVKGGTT